MKDFSKATPRPWQSVKYQGSENYYHIFSQPDKSVMYQSVCSANKIDSALILTAVNNFEKMSETIIELADIIRRANTDNYVSGHDFGKAMMAKKFIESIK